MKLVIALLIAAYFVEVLSSIGNRPSRLSMGTFPARTSSTRRIRRIPSINAKTVKSKSVDSKSTALAEIPFISTRKNMLINGDSGGKISVGGVLLYEDKNFKTAHVRCEIIENNLYINGNLVAKKPKDGTIDLQNPNINHEDIKFFAMKIRTDGIFEYSHDGLPASVWM